MKTLLVHYRRWGITVIILLLPIIYNLLSNIIYQNRNENGRFDMNINSLNPQTILYNTDTTIEKYFRASIDGAVLEQHIENISEMNENILGKFIKSIINLYLYCCCLI